MRLPGGCRAAAAAVVIGALAGCGIPVHVPFGGGSGPSEVWVVSRDARAARNAVTPAAPAIFVRHAGSTQAPVALDLVRSDVTVTVVGPLVSVTRSNRYAAPPSGDETFVAFTPPPSPAQQDFAIRAGSRVARVLVREPDEAHDAYESARRDGQTAMLLSADASGRVVVPLAGDAGDLVVETVGIAGWHDGAYELTVPRVPEGDATLTVDLHGGGPVVVVNSPSHSIDARPIALDHLRVTLQEPSALRTDDFVLRYRVDPSESPGALLVEPDGGGTLVGLLVHPQEDNHEPVALANVTIDWGTAQVSEVRPPAIGTIAPGRPLVVLARVRGGWSGPVTVTGRASGRPRTLTVDVEASPPAQGLQALPVLWARAARGEAVAAR